MAELAKQQRPEGLFRDDPACGSFLPSGSGWQGSFPHGPRSSSLCRWTAGRNWTGQHVFKACHLHTPAHGQELESSRCPQNQGSKKQTPMCLLSSQHFSWTDCPSPWVSPPQQARGCAWDLRVAYGLSEDQERLLLRKFFGFCGVSDGKESVCHAGDQDSIPGSGRTP